MGVHIVQGLFIDNPTIRELVTRMAPVQVVSPIEAAELLEAEEPRAPTAREVEALDLMTLARLIYRWQAELDGPLIVSVRSMVERVRSLGFTPGRVERYTAGLAELEGVGILERANDGPQSPRRVAVDWVEANARLSA